MESPLFRYNIAARSHWHRAKQLLQRFDDARDVESFFAAALHLRMGIEARLYEYLDAALDEKGKAKLKGTDYEATKLLARLKDVNPDAERGLRLRITMEGSDKPGAEIYFTPVSRKLAGYHGRLGGYLHYAFFRQNRYWYLDRDTDASHGSLRVHRTFLGEVSNELDVATRGQLLAHPHFTPLLESLVESESDDTEA